MPYGRDVKFFFLLKCKNYIVHEVTKVTDDLWRRWRYICVEKLFLFKSDAILSYESCYGISHFTKIN